MSWAHHPTWQWPSMTHRKQQSSSRSLTDCELMHIIIQHHPWGPFFVTSVSLSFKSWCTIPIKSHQLPLNPINSHCLILRGSIPYWGMAEEVKNIPVETVEMPHPQDHDAPIWLMIFTALWFLEHIFRHLDSWWLMYTMVYQMCTATNPVPSASRTTWAGWSLCYAVSGDFCDPAAVSQHLGKRCLENGALLRNDNIQKNNRH